MALRAVFSVTSPAIVASGSATVVANDSDAPAPAPTAAQQSVIVLVDKHVARPTEVIGVLDFHSDAMNEDKGFEELRGRAAAMGADAVIGAEFEHGEGTEPSHLSGVAVRFLDR
jgi:hypothetical protein